jgi:hypothetical protein
LLKEHLDNDGLPARISPRSPRKLAGISVKPFQHDGGNLPIRIVRVRLELTRTLASRRWFHRTPHGTLLPLSQVFTIFGDYSSRHRKIVESVVFPEWF